MIHVLAMLAYAVIAYFGLTDQVITQIAISIVPGFLLFTLLIWVVGFEPAKPKHMFF